MTPDGGVIAEDTLISLALPGAGPRPSSAPGLGPGCTIKYTCDGEVPTSESSPYNAPFRSASAACATRGDVALRDDRRRRDVPGRAAEPGLAVVLRAHAPPPPIVVPTGIVRSCLPVRVNVRSPCRWRATSGGRAPPRYAAAGRRRSAPRRDSDGDGLRVAAVRHRGVSYDTCTEVDWPGNPWCYVQGETCGTTYFTAASTAARLRARRRAHAACPRRRRRRLRRRRARRGAARLAGAVAGAVAGAQSRVPAPRRRETLRGTDRARRSPPARSEAPRASSCRPGGPPTCGRCRRRRTRRRRNSSRPIPPRRPSRSSATHRRRRPRRPRRPRRRRRRRRKRPKP